MTDSADLIQQAIASSRSGDREAALRILLKLVEQDDHNARAWVLLSNLVEDEEDQLIALENALVLLPGDEKLLARRAALLKAHPHLGPLHSFVPDNSVIDHARQLAADGQIPQAINLLHTLAAKNPENAPAWAELAMLEPIHTDRIQAAEKALAADPTNLEIRAMLTRLRDEHKNPFLYGQHLEEQGQFEQAVELYISIITHSRLASDRIKAQRRMENIQLRQESHEAQPVHPDLNLWRLSLGPVLLFLMMIFMQSGLKPAHIPFLALPGLFSVAAGGLLVAITEMIPAHPGWVKIFGQPGTEDEPEMRRGLRLLGWALMFAPYTIVLLEAGRRLGELQASMLPGLR